MNKIGDMVRFEGRRFRAIPYTECTQCAFYDNGIDCTQHEALSCVDDDLMETTMMFKELCNFTYGK